MKKLLLLIIINLITLNSFSQNYGQSLLYITNPTNCPYTINGVWNWYQAGVQGGVVFTGPDTISSPGQDIWICTGNGSVPNIPETLLSIWVTGISGCVCNTTFEFQFTYGPWGLEICASSINELSLNNLSNYNVMDFNGKTLLKNVDNIESLPSGIYFIQLPDRVFKIIKTDY